MPKILHFLSIQQLLVYPHLRNPGTPQIMAFLMFQVDNWQFTSLVTSGITIHDGIDSGNY